jgi:hypothetical protein
MGVVSAHGHSSGQVDLRRGHSYLDAMITIESDEEAVRVTIPRGAVDDGHLGAFLAWLRDESAAREQESAGRPRRSLSEIAADSRMTVEEADRMADQAKTRWWAGNRHRFIQPDEPGV